MAHDSTLKRVTVANDDGDVYVESVGTDAEIVLKTQKVRVDGDVYCGASSSVGISSRVDTVETTHAALESRVNALNATEVELSAVMTSRLDALNATNAELKASDVAMTSRLDALNATNAELKANETALLSRINELLARVDALSNSTLPPKCIPPGGEKLQYDGTQWTCVCVGSWSGETCETPPSPRDRG